MKAWSLFYPDTVPDVRMAPLPMVDHYLRNAAIEFCTRSMAWVQTLALVDAVAGQQGYLLPMAADTELVEIQDAWFNGEQITPKSPLFLRGKYDDWTAEVGTPEHYTQEDLLNILLVPAPADVLADAIKVKAAIKPGPEATGVDDWLFAEYRLAIVAGAKAALQSLPGVPWASPDHAMLNQAKFEAAIETATGNKNDGHVKSMPRFSGSFC